VEWVETTGPTLEAAKDAALDQLGVDEEDAEFEVLEEPKTGLFGRLRSEARVRARVRPATPRPKEGRRDRRQRRTEPGGRSGRGRSAAAGAKGSAEPGAQGGDRDQDGDAAGTAPRRGTRGDSGDRGGEERRPSSTGPGRRRRQRGGRGGERERDAASVERAELSDGGAGMDVSLEEQGEVAEDFLAGLVEAFGLRATISATMLDDETLELSLDGEDLNLLIGARGMTLQAIQDLTRTVVQRQTKASYGRLLVDVLGYRKKRRVALERFARQLADEVRTAGSRRALEPMSASDRKVVHDVVNTLDGVTTTSEGEEPNRRVVILPADS